MELATRSSYGVPHSLLAPSTSGRSVRSAKLSGTSSLKNSFQGRRPSLVVTAKKYEDPANKSSADVDTPDAKVATEGQTAGNGKITPPTRVDVLKACRSTSAGLAAAAIAIRQGTHWAAEANYPVHDCYLDMTYSFVPWHIVPTAGTVVLIASLRQILLLNWPEFAASSQKSNKEVLSPLQLGEYAVVSFLPGFSEELFFRGAILPLVGVDFSGAAVAGVVFGVLHLTGGRNAAFAAWASFVGVVYGLAAIYTNDLAVPMVAHSIANLVAAYLWRIEEDKLTNEEK